MILVGKITATAKYKGKSLYPFWMNIQKGDVLTCDATLRNNGDYKIVVRLYNNRTDESFHASWNEAANYLSKVPHLQGEISSSEGAELLEVASQSP